MLNRFINFLKPGLFQFSISFLLLLLLLLNEFFGLFNSKSLSEFFIDSYTSYGLVIILLASFIEALFIISIYLPASLVIVLSAFALGFDLITLVSIGGLSIIGFTIANIINYYLGRYGYYRVLLKLGGRSSIKKVEEDFNNNQFKTIFLSSFHPNFLAITMVYAGISKSNLGKVIFQSIISLVFWVSLWMLIITLLFKNYDYNINESNTTGYYFIVIIFLWGLFKCILKYSKFRANLK